MTTDLVSVIIPVYNVEKYLLQCIESIINQTYSNLEIILVDDGSGDQSGKICDKFAAKESRIIVIHKQNGGVSSARNAGLIEASGEYVTFVDADDILPSLAIENLVSIATKSRADCTTGLLKTFSDSATPESTSNNFTPTIELVDGNKAVKYLLYQERIFNGPVAKLYKLNLVKSIKYKTGITVAEDLLFNYQALTRAKSVAITNSLVYFYRLRQGSAMRQAFSNKRMSGLYVTKDILNDTDKRKAAIQPARDRLFMEAVFIGSQIIDRPEYRNEYEICKKTMRKYSKTIIRDIDAPITHRLIAFAAFFNTYIALYLFNYKANHNRKNMSIIVPVFIGKNVLVLTHALGKNYGGIAQAFAMQKIITSLGINTTISHAMPKRRLISYLKQSAIESARNFNIHIYSKAQDSYVTQYTNIFINRYVQNTSIMDGRNIDTCSIKEYDAFIVGSDQVWRKSYVKVSRYMLDFIPRYAEITRISYAASFGTEDITEYSDELIKTTAKLAKNFDAISVREDSGITIANKYWGVQAEQHVDPTLLLGKEDYQKLIDEDRENVTSSTGTLFTYILDENSNKLAIINKIAAAKRLTSFSIMPKNNPTLFEWLQYKKDFILPRVTQWLKSFDDAEFVVTDSFHGCVFSIIFNKPFIAIGNKQRGMARFTSLLKTFGLENRLVSDASEVTNALLKSKIEWKRVNDKISKERNRSLKYLRNNLC